MVKDHSEFTLVNFFRYGRSEIVTFRSTLKSKLLTPEKERKQDQHPPIPCKKRTKKWFIHFIRRGVTVLLGFFFRPPSGANVYFQRSTHTERNRSSLREVTTNVLRVQHRPGSLFHYGEKELLTSVNQHPPLPRTVIWLLKGNKKIRSWGLGRLMLTSKKKDKKRHTSFKERTKL